MPATQMLTYKIEKMPNGFIGQCVEVPQILAQAKTKPSLDKKMGVVIDGYFKACPEAYKNLKKTVGYAQYEIKKNS